MVEDGIEGFEIGFVRRDINALEFVYPKAIAAFSVGEADPLDFFVGEK
jgi:hypothetical protein